MTERTNPSLWEKIKNNVLANDKGGKSGQWSARKAQLAVLEYKKKGGGYKGGKSADNSLIKWTNENWRTKSGLKSSETGERYLPSKAIETLSNKEYEKTSRIKKKDMKEGHQYSKQPKEIINKIRMFL